MFGKTTGSSNLCEHLVGLHRNEWVKLCLERGLTIKGKDGLAVKVAYEAEQLGEYLTNPSEVYLMIDPNLVVRHLWITLLNGLSLMTR